MRVATFRHRAGTWEAPLDAALDSPQTLVLAFVGASVPEPAGLVAQLRRAWPTAVLVGCSTAGEILGVDVDDDTAVVAVARFDGTTLRRAVAPLARSRDSRAAGAAIAAQLAADDLAGVFVLSPGLDVNGSELVRGLNEHLPPGVVVTGGLAGDGSRFEHTWVIGDDEPNDAVVTAVGLFGDRVRIRHGSRGGWNIFGPQRRVTRSDGNVLYELDGKPALQLYREYLGHLARGLPATALRFPLALREDADSPKKLVRTVLAVDEGEQSMTFAGDMPSGWLAQLMRSNFDQLVSGAEQAARLTGAAPEEGPCLAIAISCVGRRMVLGEGSEEEVEATRDILPAGTTQVGFYSYGELAPYDTGDCDLHNQTMTLTTIQEG